MSKNKLRTKGRMKAIADESSVSVNNLDVFGSKAEATRKIGSNSCEFGSQTAEKRDCKSNLSERTTSKRAGEIF
jgi:hypothetical protein